MNQHLTWSVFIRHPCILSVDPVGAKGLRPLARPSTAAAANANTKKRGALLKAISSVATASFYSLRTSHASVPGVLQDYVEFNLKVRQ